MACRPAGDAPVPAAYAHQRATRFEVEPDPPRTVRLARGPEEAAEIGRSDDPPPDYVAVPFKTTADRGLRGIATVLRPAVGTIRGGSIVKRAPAALVMAAIFIVSGTANAYADASRQVGGASTDINDYYSLASIAGLSSGDPSGSDSDQAYMYYWTGTFLSMGDFFQAGEVTHASSCASGSVGYFFEAFYPNGSDVFAGGPQITCANMDRNLHEFRVQHVGTIGTGEYEWAAYFDHAQITTSVWVSSSVDMGTHTPYFISELSGASLPSSSDQLGVSTFKPASETLYHNGSIVQSASANAYTDNAVCPPETVAASAVQYVHAGTGISGCTSNGTRLW